MDERRPRYVISIAAQLAGMHPQTLRQYDRLGIVSPTRTGGRGRRYSQADIDRLIEVQKLSQEEGINLAGIKRILDLQGELTQLQSEMERMANIVAGVMGRRVFTANRMGEVVAMPRGQRPARGNPQSIEARKIKSSTAMIRRSPSPMVVWSPDSGDRKTRNRNTTNEQGGAAWPSS